MADMAVLDDDDLVGPAKLLVHGAAERGFEVVGSIAAVDGQQQGERGVHDGDATDAKRPASERATSRA